VTAHLSALQERILLELAGRGNRVKVSVRDLCETIGMDPAEWERANTALILGNMISYQSNMNEYENPYYSITWVGEDWLAKRPQPSIGPLPRRRWFGFARRGLDSASR